MRLCSKSGAKVKDYPADVTDERAVESLFSSVRDDFGSVDGVINNAGITSDALLVKAADGKVLKKMSLTEFHRVIAVDLRGVFLCGREAAVQMIESGHGGVIINTSSISRAGNVGQTNYSAAKAGVAAMTVTWAKELARYKIRVAGIAPGFSEKRMVATIPPKVKDRVASIIPVRRFAKLRRSGVQRTSSCRPTITTAEFWRSMADCGFEQAARRIALSNNHLQFGENAERKHDVNLKTAQATEFDAAFVITPAEASEYQEAFGHQWLRYCGHSKTSTASAE